LSTKVFQGLAAASAKGRGMPALPQVIVPSPYDTLEEEKVREIAYRALDDTVAALLVPNRGVVTVPASADAAGEG
jgi:hypothetical protein